MWSKLGEALFVPQASFRAARKALFGAIREDPDAVGTAAQLDCLLCFEQRREMGCKHDTFNLVTQVR